MRTYITTNLTDALLSGESTAYVATNPVFLYTEYSPNAVSLTSVSISPIHLGMVTVAEGSEHLIPDRESIGAESTNVMPIISKRSRVTMT